MRESVPIYHCTLERLSHTAAATPSERGGEQESRRQNGQQRQRVVEVAVYAS